HAARNDPPTAPNEILDLEFIKLHTAQKIAHPHDRYAVDGFVSIQLHRRSIPIADGAARPNGERSGRLTILRAVDIVWRFVLNLLMRRGSFAPHLGKKVN